MQKNADQVEKDVLRAEELLAVVRKKTVNDSRHLLHWQISKLTCSPFILFRQDAENDKKELPFQHQTMISDKLGEAEGLLRDLFLDLDKAKKLKHPQAREIENEWVKNARKPCCAWSDLNKHGSLIKAWLNLGENSTLKINENKNSSSWDYI